jgi:TfoX/Sxy family transcriptional regulator of competence genes
MAYDEALADRVRKLLAGRNDVSERRMFGGLAFMVSDHMACGVLGPDLIVRVGPDGADEALAQPHARPFDFTGRPSRGIVYVGPGGCATDEDLTAWLDRGLTFVSGQRQR